MEDPLLGWAGSCLDLPYRCCAEGRTLWDVWGAIGLYRMPDRPLFDVYEQAFLAAISPLMADAVRRALLIGESADPEGPDAPGMIVLGPNWHPESMSPGVEEWLRVPLAAADNQRVAVIIEPAHPSRIAPLLMSNEQRSVQIGHCVAGRPPVPR
jgi:hypothetical protein